jgi:DNA-binding response OmpR family regulator
MEEKNEVKRKILIIDDDTFLLDMYSLKFTQAGYVVETANDPVQVIPKIQSGGAPDIMLVDLVMPNMSGFDLLRTINEMKIAENTIKIILSNRGEEDDIKKGMELGVKNYIIKANVTPNEVVEKVTASMQK